jgi:hypothetical protein
VQGSENRDELQLELDNIISVRFIPIFGANTKNIEGHTTKKDIPMLLAIESFSGVPMQFIGQDCGRHDQKNRHTLEFGVGLMFRKMRYIRLMEE